MDDKARQENFERIRAGLEAQGWKGTQHTISILRANLMAFVTAGPFAALCAALFLTGGKLQGGLDFSWASWGLFVLLMIASAFAHECLHGLTWGIFCRNGFRSIHIGFQKKTLTPYCCCLEALPSGAYLLGALMPFMILGFGFFAVSMATGRFLWLLLGMFNILAAGGDTTIAGMLLRRRRALIVDHPTECGFWAFSKA